MKDDMIKLTYDQWNRLGFRVKKGVKGLKTYSADFETTWYTFDETQVVRNDGTYDYEGVWASEADIY
jgi:hypothetical protein